MSTLRSMALDVALVLAFVVCTAHAQVISWSRGLTASTTLTIGVRLDPTSSRWLDSRLRPFSPYRDARRPNGAYLLPDYRLTAHTCDVQHLTWLGIGDWEGMRFEPMWMWFPIGYVGARLSNAPLSIAAMNTYTLTRSALVPGYHFDPLGYSASIWTTGTAGALLGAHRLNWRTALALGALWSIAYPWGTPWADDPANCGHRR